MSAYVVGNNKVPLINT